MSSVQLCMFCDNQLKPGFKQCHVCDADVAESFAGLSINTKPSVANDRSTGSQMKQATGGDIKTEDSLPRTVLKVGGGIAPISPETAVEVSELSASDVAGWACGYCTLVNKSTLLTCAVCFQARNKTEEDKEDAKEEKPVVWFCKSCKCHIQSGSEFCYACLRQKEEGAKSRDTTKRIYPVLDVEDKNVPTDCRTSWLCMKCEYSNAMLALKCYSCENHNQIYRLCKHCTKYFIMNDNDHQCVNCPSYDKRALNNDDQANTGSVPQKQSLLTKLGIKSKKKNTWTCSNGGCNAINKEKSLSCKSCGVDKDAVNDVKDAEELRNVPKKKSSILNVFKGKEKPWYCDDSTCRGENPKSSDKCQRCGVKRAPTNAAHNSEAMSTNQVANSENSNNSNISKSTII